MWHIFRMMLREYPPDELDLIHYTVNAYANPILHVNIPEAEKQHKKELRKRHRLVKKTGATIKDFASREKFAELLRGAGCAPPLKLSPRTGNPTYAFAKNDLAFQELQFHPSEEVRNLVEARLICATNINITRALRLISHANPALPLFLKYGGAHTLRWSGGDKNNPQNYPRDGRLRRCIIAPPGYLLVVIDSRQIEARWNAFLAGQDDLVEAFREGRDVYREFAAEEVYHIPLKKIKKPQRFVGKVCILQLGYQSAWEKFQWTLASGSMGDKVVLDNSTSQDTVKNYRERYNKIRDQWYHFQNQFPLMRDGGSYEYGPIVFEKERVWLPNDMYIRYPRIRSITQEGKKWPQWVYNDDRKIYGGQFVQNIIEALSRITVGEQVLRIAERYRVVNLIHDEVILCVPKRSAETALRFGLKQFNIPPTWAPDLPVAGEGAISECYAKN
jgi:DNA polymerase